jgi:hypothetical protein
VLGLAAVCSVTLVPSLRAEPITVTSGQFVVESDDLPFLQISGMNGFSLLAGFIRTASSPCSLGCAPGSPVSMGAVGGGASTGYELGQLTTANINGREFGNGGMNFMSPRLTGTLLFDAPTLTSPPATDGGALLTAPFQFNGAVTGFAHDDLNGRVPLFHVTLVGQGTVSALFLPDAGAYFVESATSTFGPQTAPVPEPTTFGLVAAGVLGVVARVLSPFHSRLQEAPSGRLNLVPEVGIEPTRGVNPTAF